MKIFILTTELSQLNGLGRYSIDMLDALHRLGTKTVVATSREDVSSSDTVPLNILPRQLDYKSSYVLAILYAWQLRKHTKDCDVIHSFAEQYAYIAYWLSKFTGKKYIITSHGTWAVLPYTLSFYKRYFHKRSFESASKVICVSNYTKKCLEKFGLDNLQVINNGINAKKFTQTQPLSWEGREDLIVSVGNLKRRKGYETSISAFAKTQTLLPKFNYCIVGDQSDDAHFNKLKKLASDLGVKDKINFLQHISDDELISIYRRAKLFVLTSISEKSHFEGFGLVYLEANACGLPVIGSLESGAEDAISDGNTGLLVSQHDVNSVSDAITRIIGDKDLSEKMSRQAIKWADKHDMDKVIINYMNEYKLGLNNSDK